MRIRKSYQNKIWLACSILLSILLISSVFSTCAKSAVFSTKIVKPESVGLSSGKLNEIDTALQADVDANKISGAVLLVARDGKVAYFKSFDYRDNEKKLPMEKDSIFRIHSMTKSLTAVAIAMLKDEGKLKFEDPVEKYIPSFKDIQVGEISKDQNGEDIVTMVKPTTVMTIQHLATHTSGLSYSFMAPPAIQKFYIQAGLNKPDGLTNEEVCDKLAKVPLVENPGTLWRYGMSYDVLGRVVEVVSGMPLDKFFEERIYKPLGMKDSGYLVTGENTSRLVYLDPEWPFYSDVTDPNKKNLSGGSGSVSTAVDWARFAQMLLNGGELDGKRLLKPETVTFITSDLLGSLSNRSDALYTPGSGYSVGFDFCVRIDISNVDFPANIGEFYKAGMAGTQYWVDPKEQLIAVFMVNTTNLTLPQYYRDLIQSKIYNAIIGIPEAPPETPPTPGATTSFPSATYTNDEYGFSIQYPKYWKERPEMMTSPYFVAMFGIPTSVPVVGVAVFDADAPVSEDWIIESTKKLGHKDPKVKSDIKEETLAGGIKAYTCQLGYITATGYEAVGYFLMADKDGKRIRLGVVTVEGFSPYDEKLFSEIAHTLTFK